MGRGLNNTRVLSGSAPLRVNRALPGRPALQGSWLACLLCALLFAGAAPLAVLAQSGGEGGEGADEPRSAEQQEIDREEAEFRRRMELEEGDPGDDDARALPLPDVIDVAPAAAPDDSLPPESREHLDELMTELIIQNGRWEPSDAQRPADFEPSEAAQADPELAAEEAAAWEEMVAAYHEREAKAAGVTLPGGQGDSAGAQGTGPGDGSSTGTGSGTGNGTGNDAGAGASAPAGSSTPAAGERPPQDEAFSALEFLREQGAVEAADAGEGAPAESIPEKQPGVDSGAGAESGTPSGADTNEDVPDEQASPVPPEDSMPVEALEALFADGALGPPGSESDQGGQSDGAPATEAPDAVSETAAGNAGDPAASADPGSTGEPADPSEASAPTEQDEAADPADASDQSQPPPTGFLAWLKKLFGA